MKRERLIEIMNEQYDGDCETFDAESAADFILDEMEKGKPDSTGPAGAGDVGEFSWKVWTGSGRQISEVALIRSGACCGYVWRLAKGGWAFGLERKAAISEGSIFPDALNGLLAHVRAHAALTPSVPIAAPVRDDGARDIEDLCNSVLGNCYLGKGPEEALATKIKASLRSAPASAVPGELP